MLSLMLPGYTWKPLHIFLGAREGRHEATATAIAKASGLSLAAAQEASISTTVPVAAQVAATITAITPS
jgi:hypothetical protein